MASFHKQQTKKGVALGTLIPVIFSPLVCFLIYSYRVPRQADGTNFQFWEFYETLLGHQTQLPTFISLCALANLPVFFYLLNKKKDWIARGMIYSTMAYAIVYFILKLN